MDLETLKEEVRARADIVDVVGRTVRLQKASGSWKGLCPFHDEKTPSFTVNQRRQSYHCFGCGAGGDVFKFVMETEHLEFMEALEKLANQVGVPFELDGRKGDGNKKKRLLELHEKTAAWYQHLLHEDARGREAKVYMEGRKLAPATPESFRLGYAPDGFDLFLKKARGWGYSDEELEASGLVGVRENPRHGERLYDRFRDRLMFPIVDEQSRVIGFSGRAIPPKEVKAKYLNSPETLLFKKSRVLYGIDKARKIMAEKRRAILCEGQLDVIRCHESGLTEAVAAQGTAITEDHARILKRYADEVLLVLDADTAGVKAALRSSEVLMVAGLAVKVCSLPEGSDPDDLVRSEGPDKLRDTVERSDPFVQFQVRTLVQQEGEINEASRLRVARQVMETLNKVPEAIHREELTRQAAGALGMREEALRQDLQPVAPPAPSKPAPPHPPHPEEFMDYPPPEDPYPPQGRPSYPNKGRGTYRKKKNAGPPPQPPPTVPRPAAGTPPSGEVALLEMLVAEPSLVQVAQLWIQPKHLVHAGTQELLHLLYEWNPTDTDSLQDHAREHPKSNELFALLATTKLVLNPEFGLPEETIKELSVILRREALSRNRKELLARQRTASPDQQQELDAEIWRLRNLDNQLKTCFGLRDWEKASVLVQMIDMQED